MEKTKLSVQASSLMKLILVERFNDLDNLEHLCKQLLKISETAHDTYGISFANLYMFDAFFARGDHEQARIYLLRTQSLCEHYNYQDLLMVFHNLAGLYYHDIFDEHSALQHYLSALDLAQKLDDPITESKIYNNLGICFRRRHDNPAALQYFNAAYETIKTHITDEVRNTAISFLCNASEIYQAMNMAEKSASTLQKAQDLYADNEYSYLQLKSNWCGHYAVCGSKERSIAIAKELIDDGLCDFEHVQFVSSAYFEIFDHMMLIDCQEMAHHYLSLIASCCSYKNIGEYYNYITRKIKYYERYETSAECEQVYKEFYTVSLKLNKVDDALHVENILSKIELKKALFEVKAMRRENKQLENASHIDELTQLYNRRYISKLKTKVLMGNQNTSLGYIMLDVDYFKEYNDFYGHSKGDEVLQSVANTIKNHAKEDIYASRFGGDEFLILLVNYTNDQIIDYIQAIQDELRLRDVPHEKSKVSTRLTLSIGFSNGFVVNENMYTSLLKCADQALYQAKEDGRNRFHYQAAEY